jgi:hypothetical protein
MNSETKKYKRSNIWTSSAYRKTDRKEESHIHRVPRSRKVFDNVNWNILFHTLQKVRVEQQDLKILHSLYKQQTAEIKKGEAIVIARIKKD